MTFDREWEREYDDVKVGINAAVLSAATYGWNLVTSKTPVRTGRARSSWNLSVNTPNDDTKAKVTPYPKAKNTGLVYEVSNHDYVKFDATNGDSLIISNNVEYIQYLELGSDTVRPFAMVSSSLPAIRRKLAIEMRKIKGAND